mmetsp:Transcript_15919/g.20101  ORF Transcript_15919/g.20101 Transcript_15919/m.20101 type:complete len:85 (-) Transcript_15919:209-463(-)
MKRKIPEQAKATDALIRKISAKPRDDQAIDQAVKAALQQARRNMTTLQKKQPGIYQVKNRTRLVMMDLDASTLQVTASYMSENG